MACHLRIHLLLNDDRAVNRRWDSVEFTWMWGSYKVLTLNCILFDFCSLLPLLNSSFQDKASPFLLCSWRRRCLQNSRAWIGHSGVSSQVLTLVSVTLRKKVKPYNARQIYIMYSYDCSVNTHSRLSRQTRRHSLPHRHRQTPDGRTFWMLYSGVHLVHSGDRKLRHSDRDSQQLRRTVSILILWTPSRLRNLKPQYKTVMCSSSARASPNSLVICIPLKVAKLCFFFIPRRV